MEEKVELWRNSKPHMVLCAALGRGHVTPMVCLARKLSSTGKVSVTFVFLNTAALNSVHQSVSCSPDISCVVLDPSDITDDPPWMIKRPFPVRFGSSPSTLRQSTSTASEHTTAVSALDFSSYEAKLESLLSSLLATTSPPTCLVSDFSLPWTSTPAESLKLPRYVLYTDPATFMAVAYYAETLVDQGILPVSDKHSTQKIYVPGVPPLLQSDISHLVWDSSQPSFARTKLWHKQTVQSNGILLNTFYELESSAMDALRTVILPRINIITVGPLVCEVETVFESSRGDDCLRWLDSKPECSVLYLSFGSYEYLPDEQVLELAKGLESSGSSFLWRMTLPPGCMNVETLLPNGFCERVIKSGRGLIVTGWVPQQMILRHAAVGGFVTHCGWNSVLECVCLGGVGMVCWPLVADQPTTCRFVVDGLGIGVEVHEDETGFVDEFEIDNAVRTVMVGEKAERMRNLATKFKELAKGVRGNVDEFIQSFKI